MSILEDIKSKLKRIFGGENYDSGSQFLQWKHRNMRKTHCFACQFNHLRIFANDESKPQIGNNNHPFAQRNARPSSLVRQS